MLRDCISCDITIKSIEPNLDEVGNVVSVVYKYGDGREQTIMFTPSSDLAGTTESMEPVVGNSQSTGRPDIFVDDGGYDYDSDVSVGDGDGRGGPGGRGGGRKSFRITRRVRSLRNKNKTKRGKKKHKMTKSRTWLRRSRRKAT